MILFFAFSCLHLQPVNRCCSLFAWFNFCYLCAHFFVILTHKFTHLSLSFSPSLSFSGSFVVVAPLVVLFYSRQRWPSPSNVTDGTTALAPPPPPPHPTKKKAVALERELLSAQLDHNDKVANTLLGFPNERLSSRAWRRHSGWFFRQLQSSTSAKRRLLPREVKPAEPRLCPIMMRPSTTAWVDIVRSRWSIAEPLNFFLHRL